MTEKRQRNFIMTSVTVAGGLWEVLRCNKKIKPTPLPRRQYQNECWDAPVQVPIFGLGGAGQTPLSWWSGK